MIEDLLIQIASQGLLGIFLVLVLVAYYKKDQKIGELRDQRLGDMREIKDQYTKLLVEITSTLDKLVSLIRGK